MCDDGTGTWIGLGTILADGDCYVIEQCRQCLGYRARRLDLDEIDVVERTPTDYSETNSGSSASSSEGMRGVLDD